MTGWGPREMARVQRLERATNQRHTTLLILPLLPSPLAAAQVSHFRYFPHQRTSSKTGNSGAKGSVWGGRGDGPVGKWACRAGKPSAAH